MAIIHVPTLPASTNFRHGNTDTNASSIVKALVKNYDAIEDDLAFWQRAIREQTEYMSSSDLEYTRRIKVWYDNENKNHSYSVEGFRVKPEHSEMFVRFKNDPNYHLKNLVEMVARCMIEEYMRESGLKVETWVTSDCDDVLWGMDVICAFKWKTKTKYIGFDVTISENRMLLSEKADKTSSLCTEFNKWKSLWENRIPRKVLAIPPRIMAKFLSEFMDRVSSGWIEQKDILPLFRWSWINAEEVWKIITNSVMELLH